MLHKIDGLLLVGRKQNDAGVIGSLYSKVIIEVADEMLSAFELCNDAASAVYLAIIDNRGSCRARFINEKFTLHFEF